MATSPPHALMVLISATMAGISNYHFVILPPSLFNQNYLP